VFTRTKFLDNSHHPEPLANQVSCCHLNSSLLFFDIPFLRNSISKKNVARFFLSQIKGSNNTFYFTPVELAFPRQFAIKRRSNESIALTEFADGHSLGNNTAP
jgi:hypothetical protein